MGSILRVSAARGTAICHYRYIDDPDLAGAARWLMLREPPLFYACLYEV
jgi:hypothetical protein